MIESSSGRAAGFATGVPAGVAVVGVLVVTLVVVAAVEVIFGFGTVGGAAATAGLLVSANARTNDPGTRSLLPSMREATTTLSLNVSCKYFSGAMRWRAMRIVS